jgi:single-strand DNA-binding protein
MASLNKVQLIGNLGQDPELRYTPNGSAVATFSVATTDRWTDKGGQKQEKTEWHRVEVWNKPAEFLGEYARKGAQIYVEGSLATDKYTDKEGVERYTTKVKAQSVQLLDRRPQSDDNDHGDDHGGYSEERPEAQTARPAARQQQPARQAPARQEEQPQPQAAAETSAPRQGFKPKRLFGQQKDTAQA